ncbi:MAG: hypothetical protein ACK55I_23655, partial [bacterium]
ADTVEPGAEADSVVQPWQVGDQVKLPVGIESAQHGQCICQGDKRAQQGQRCGLFPASEEDRQRRDEWYDDQFQVLR